MESSSGLLLKIKELCLNAIYDVRLAAVCSARMASSSVLLLEIKYLNAMSVGGLAASLLSQDG
jgi:hypothetical protein